MSKDIIQTRGMLLEKFSQSLWKWYFLEFRVFRVHEKRETQTGGIMFSRQLPFSSSFYELPSTVFLFFPPCSSSFSSYLLVKKTTENRVFTKIGLDWIKYTLVRNQLWDGSQLMVPIWFYRVPKNLKLFQNYFMILHSNRTITKISIELFVIKNICKQFFDCPGGIFLYVRTKLTGRPDMPSRFHFSITSAFVPCLPLFFFLHNCCHSFESSAHFRWLDELFKRASTPKLLLELSKQLLTLLTPPPTTFSSYKLHTSKLVNVKQLCFNCKISLCFRWVTAPLATSILRTSKLEKKKKLKIIRPLLERDETKRLHAVFIKFSRRPQGRAIFVNFRSSRKEKLAGIRLFGSTTRASLPPGSRKKHPYQLAGPMTHLPKKTRDGGGGGGGEKGFPCNLSQ